MSAVANGDERAFELLYERLAPLVHGIARTVLREREQAEQVTQEVFVELWRTAAGYQAHDVGATAWVMALAHRRAVDLVRAERAGDPPRSVPSGGPRDAGLETLPEVERRAILLAYYEARAYRDAAMMLDVESGTLAYQLRDGLRRLGDRRTGAPTP